MEDSVYINPDQVAQERFGDWNSPDAVRQAAIYCADWREQCLSNGHSMIFENVFSVEDKLVFLLRAKEAGFFVRFFFVCTSSPMINASRIAGRVMKGGHDVPITKIISRYQKSIANCMVASFLPTVLTSTTIRWMDVKLNCFSVCMVEGKLTRQYISEFF